MTPKIHVALNVNNLEESLKFYRALWGIEPAKVRIGYAKFDVADSVEKTEASRLTIFPIGDRVKSLKLFSRQKCLQKIAVFVQFRASRQTSLGRERSVFSGLLDWELDSERLVAARSVTQRGKAEIVTEATGSVNCLRVACVDPNLQAVRRFDQMFMDIRPIPFAANFDADPQPVVIPREPHFTERGLLLKFAKIGERELRAEVEQSLAGFRNVVSATDRKRKSKQE